MAEWNTRRLTALLSSSAKSIFDAALRDGKQAELRAFTESIAAEFRETDRLAAELKAAREGKRPAAEDDENSRRHQLPRQSDAPAVINVRVSSDDGDNTYFKLKSTTPFIKLMNAWCQKKGLSISAVRFLFDETRLNADQTPADVMMEDGEVIYVLMEQGGGCIAAPVPATFDVHYDSPCRQLLSSPRALSAATAHDARALIVHLGGSLTGVPQVLSKPVLGAIACAALVEWLDSRFLHAKELDRSSTLDLRVTLGADELTALIGTDAAHAVVSAFDGPFDTIRLRRVAAAVVGEAQCVSFHTDFSKRTMQIALNADSEYGGGRLLFATREGFVQPPRPQGCAVIHDSSTVHGVTTLLHGVRYGLFLCDTTGMHERGANEIDLSYLAAPTIAQLDVFAKAVAFLEATSDASLLLHVEEYTRLLMTAQPAMWAAVPPTAAPPTVSGEAFALELIWRTHVLRPVAFGACAAMASQKEDRQADEAVTDRAPAGRWLGGVNLLADLRQQEGFMRGVLRHCAQFFSDAGVADAVAGAVADYRDFLCRVNDCNAAPCELVPSLLVDLVWHTHMQSPQRYAAECRRLAGCLVDHVNEDEPATGAAA